MHPNEREFFEKRKSLQFFIWLKQFAIGKKSLLDRYFFASTSPIKRYFRKTIDYLLQAVLLLIVTVLFNCGLLYVFQMLWELYQSTYIGETFTRTFPEKAQALSQLAYSPPFLFALELSLSTFFVCFSIAAICQLFHIARYFYYPRNLIGKVIIWGGFLAAVNAYFIYRRYQIEFLEMVFVVALIPTLCLFAACFRFASGLLPELGDIIEFLLKCFRSVCKFKFADIKKIVLDLIAKYS